MGSAREASVGLLVHVPSQSGYHAEGLDVTRLAVLSARAHAGADIHLMVVDNGSCDAVRNWLLEALADGVLDSLLLNGRNLGKVTAVSQILMTAPPGPVVYADGDLRFLPGWVGPMLAVARGFRDVGIVGGSPPLPSAVVGSQLPGDLAGADGVGELQLDERFVRDALEDTGHTGEQLVEAMERERRDRLHLLRRGGVEAVLGASHAQYLVTDALRDRLHPRLGGLALDAAEDRAFDEYLDQAGLHRLSVSQAVYRHVGNRLTADDRTELDRLSDRPAGPPRGAARGAVLWRRHPVRIGLRWLHDASFEVSQGRKPTVRDWIR